MDIKKLTQEVLLKNMTPEQQMAVLDSVQASVKEAKAVQKQKITENVDLVLQALKRIESDMLKRVDGSAQIVEDRVKTIKDGKDGKNGIDGKAGRDGKDGKNGSDGRNGKDGINGVSGERGQDGVGVQNAHIDFDGSLIIALTDGREINVGEVVPFDVAEKIRVIGNGGGTSQFVIDTLASLQTQIDNFQALSSQTGNAGKFLTTDGSVASWASVAGGLSYQGTWNASTNSPTLASSAGTNGYYYIVGTAGSTNLNGITDWQVGDWLLFNGATWQKLDQTNLVTSVAGRTGAVTIGYSDLTGTVPTWNQNTTGTASNVTGTVAIANGGTGATTAGAALTALGAYAASNPSGYTNNTGTVTSVGGTGTVNGLSLSGTVTTSGNLTLGGTLDLSSPPAIGGTTPAAGTFTTLTATGQTSLGGAAGSESFRALTGSSWVNYVQTQGATTGNQPFLWVGGANTNIALGLSSKGNGNINFFTNGGGNAQLVAAHTASAVNYVQVTGNVTNGTPIVSAQGSDAAVGLTLQSKSASILFLTRTGQARSFNVADSGSPVNYLQVQGNTATNAPILSSQGSDTNIDLTLTPKGTGVVQFGTYTATGTDTFSIAGYVTIKDSAGNSRKLAVIA